MRCSLACFALLALPAFASGQTTWYVDGSHPPPGSGTRDDPYASIQYAIDQPATSSGDTLLVRAGTYVENIDFHGKSLILLGEMGAGLTVLDGDGGGPVIRLENGEGAGTRIEGFTIRDGRGVPDPDGRLRGGGVRMFRASAEIVRCVFARSYADFGGAFRAVDAHVVVSECVIEPSKCGGGGDVESCVLELVATVIRTQWDTGCATGWPHATTALRAVGSQVTIVGCLFEENKSFSGASGVDLVDSVGEIHATTFLRNGNYPAWIIDQRGALRVEGGSVVVTASSFLENDNQGPGGAIVADGADLELRRCRFEGNRSSEPYWGGAILVQGTGDERITIDQCTFRENRSAGGSALWLGAGAARITRSSFHANVARTQYYEDEGAGGALWIDPGASARVEECVFEANEARGSSLDAGRGGAVYVKPSADVVIYRSVFVGNQCSGDMALSNHPPQGGAVYGPATLSSCTLDRNAVMDDEGVPGEGGGAYGATLNSCIVVRSSPDALAGNASASWSDVQGGWPGTGNFDLDPMVWGPEHEDFHLLPGSPCIDAGDPSLSDDDGSRLDVGALAFDPLYCGAPGAYCVSKPSAQGCVPAIAWSGTPSIAGPDDFHVLASGVLPDALAIPIWSTSGASATPFLGGTLCVAPPLHRAPPRQATSGSSPCEGELDFHFTQALMQAHGLSAGVRIYFQFWYRDPLHHDGTAAGLTDGLEAAICADA